VPPGLSGGIGSMAAHSQSASSWRMNRRLRFWGLKHRHPIKCSASNLARAFTLLGPSGH
jgi:hypothetical protein